VSNEPGDNPNRSSSVALRPSRRIPVLLPWRRHGDINPQRVPANLRLYKASACLTQPTLLIFCPLGLGGDMDNLLVKGTHPLMEKILSVCRRVALTDSTVLVSGESGDGQGVDRPLRPQQQQARRKPVHCRELWCHSLGTASKPRCSGHEKGAFTGAVGTRMGLFQLANGGTDLSRRDRGDGTTPAGQALARAAGSRDPSGWGRPHDPKSTCGSSPPPTAISEWRWKSAASARTCSTGCRSFHHRSRRCASGAPTSPCSCSTSSRSTMLCARVRRVRDHRRNHGAPVGVRLARQRA